MTEFTNPEEWEKRLSAGNKSEHRIMTEIDLRETSLVQCDLCSYQWVATRPLGTQKLECPKCGNVAMFENISKQ